MKLKERNRKGVSQKQINILNKQGYREFTIISLSKEWEGFWILARNDNGLIISASGNTEQQAYNKLINNIDIDCDGSKEH